MWVGRRTSPSSTSVLTSPFASESQVGWGRGWRCLVGFWFCGEYCSGGGGHYICTLVSAHPLCSGPSGTHDPRTTSGTHDLGNTVVGPASGPAFSVFGERCVRVAVPCSLGGSNWGWNRAAVREGGLLSPGGGREREIERERHGMEGIMPAMRMVHLGWSTGRGYSRIRKCTALGSCGGARSRSMGPLSGRCVSLFASDPCRAVHSGWSTHM